MYVSQKHLVDFPDRIQIQREHRTVLFVPCIRWGQYTAENQLWFKILLNWLRWHYIGLPRLRIKLHTFVCTSDSCFRHFPEHAMCYRLCVKRSFCKRTFHWTPFDESLGYALDAIGCTPTVCPSHYNAILSLVMGTMPSEPIHEYNAILSLFMDFHSSMCEIFLSAPFQFQNFHFHFSICMLWNCVELYRLHVKRFPQSVLVLSQQ